MDTCMVKKLQANILVVIGSLETMWNESVAINKAYWATDANTTIGGLSDSDAATYESKLIKSEYVGGITLCVEIEDFFTNELVGTSDYRSSCAKLKYGSAATPTKRTQATEEIGNRLKQVGVDCLELFKSCEKILNDYTQNEISDMIANLDNLRIISCDGLTKYDLNAAITLIEQFKNMLGNSAVTQGDYKATIALWNKY